MSPQPADGDTRSVAARIVAIVVTLRICLGVVGWASVRLFPITSVGGEWLQLQLPMSSPLWPFVGPWERWDALWYHHIAVSGYRPGTSDAAFFPIYPFLMRLGATVMGGYHVLSGLVVSTLAFAAALWVLHRLVQRDFDRGVADRTVLYIAIAPTAFFFLAPYTEALFLALSAGSFYAMRRRAWLAAGGLAALAVLCRSTGILLLAPMLVAMGRDAARRRREGTGIRSGLRALSPGYAWALLPVGALLEWFLYSVFVLRVQGGFWGAEAAWAHRAVPPWTALYDGAHALFSGNHPEEAVNLVAVLLLLIALPLMVRRLPWEYTAYALATVPVVLFREAFYSPLASAARYLVVLFPLFVLLALAGRRPWVHRTLAVVLPPMMVLLFVYYVHFGFVG